MCEYFPLITLWKKYNFNYLIISPDRCGNLFKYKFITLSLSCIASAE